MTRGRRLAAAALAGCLLASYPAALLASWARVWLATSSPSRSVGGPSTGRLENGKPIPPWGRGFRTYSILGSALGRQYVEGRVRDLLVAAFEARARAGATTHVVGETGWPSGGRFRPHRTHANGLAVDLFVPVRKGSRQSEVPTGPLTKFGYGVELDEHGRSGDLRVDFEELAALLREIDARGPEHALRIERVIIAPEYVPLLLDAPSGRKLGPLSGRLSRRPAWVRHDEHVHIDFADGRGGP